MLQPRSPQPPDMMPSRLASALLVCAFSACQAVYADPSGPACDQPGQWLIPAVPAARVEPAPALLRNLAGKQIVLLGERHDSADDHRWQLAMLTALHALRPDMAVGFEMFPRRLQPVLDRWVAGQLSEADFLKQADWDEVWGFDPELYLPLFRFAREHHLPMLALNIERGLVKQVRAAGWENVPVPQREGVGRPAEPLALYRTELRSVFDTHPALKDAAQDDTTQFARFVEAQTLWDRAMAQGIAQFRQAHPETLVVGILGAGHLRNGYGVPHQLQALGHAQYANLVTLPSNLACDATTPGLADAVFVVPPQPYQPKPRLGVSLQAAAEGVMIEKVWSGSLAEKSGLKNGDVVLQAAGGRIAGIEDLRGHIQRQPPGTWLPLLIRRGGATQEIVVRFPPATEPVAASEPAPASPPHPLAATPAKP